MTIQPLLTEAHHLLTTNSRDDIHDLSHHQRVWENVRTIVDSLDRDEQQPDMAVLEVATFWHDVMIRPESLALGEDGLLAETAAYLEKLMQEQGYDPNFQKRVLAAMKHHNFLTKFQQTLESKILFDADKLDALNPKRYRRIMAAITHKKMSKVQIFLYVQAAKLWLRTMRRRYHFPKSRELHDRSIAALLEDHEAVQLAQKLGVDIQSLTKTHTP